MALDPAFLDEIRQRTPLTSLIGRRHKLTRSGRNWKTCCPFHGEKTPSFYIYDDHFHCFGCGVHGDAITFVMQSDGSSFPEAVERLASEAGLEMPKADPHQEERIQERLSLLDVLEKVQAWYRRKLYQPEGRAGLSYLEKRGLNEATLERFGIGWSGDGRSLIDAMHQEGVTVEQLTQVGLLRVDDQGKSRGELFFNRVTFPIRDQKGRVISFGGRIIGDGQPKYLNGPETPLFSKRRTLFNLNYAMTAVRKQEAELIVVEGYMDVIALDQGGFKGAVAPLGTALGEQQLELLWRLSPAPILCLDGDAAGMRAALRVCETALPFLSPEKTLCFCRLEAGDDPDSVIQREGKQGMAAYLGAARPMADELFALLTAHEVDPGPERRAALRERLVALAQKIPDRNLSSEYRSTFLDLFFARFRRRRGLPMRQERGKPETRQLNGQLVAEGGTERLNIMTALLLRHPEILPHVEHAYMQLALPDPLESIRAALLDWAGQSDVLNEESCLLWMKKQGLENYCHSLMQGPLPRKCRVDGGSDDIFRVGILESWWHFYGLVNFVDFERDVQQSVQEAIMHAYSSAESEEGGEFPSAILARMRVLEALRRGEQLELDNGTDPSL
ncbi:DNA primase [Saccharibacter sp. 17.LH.SD]|uniref:DNA primase n=1 Tax=Saccharibacter sp. 17.LH.SD TaxID=2689393 RepID=UPI0013720359|nr:DNA primase [Saccharibacter sp. 17.LH.SD]MXV44784.1 DNA primase [Saccharibacter sp. 17.LH.SD]